MKILHIGKYYPPDVGGIEKVNFDCVEGLNSLGYKTDVFCYNNKIITEINNQDKGYKVYRISQVAKIFSTPLSFSFYANLKKVIHQYVIVHIHLPNPIAAMIFQITGYNGKVVLHWHSDIIKQKKLKLIYKPFQRRLLKRADKIIVTSPNYLEHSDELQNYKSKCTIIPIGIDEDEMPFDFSFYKKLKQKYKHKKLVFSLGRLTYYKGFELLIEAAKELPENVIILIGGNGELENSLKEMISNMQLENKVLLLGKIKYSELSSYYKAADLFCLPSFEKSEAFGVVLLEAMSFGCPQIVFNIKGSGVPWVVKNNYTGFVVESIESKSLAKMINMLIFDSDLLKEFSRQSINRQNLLFKKQDMINKIAELYNQIFD